MLHVQKDPVMPRMPGLVIMGKAGTLVVKTIVHMSTGMTGMLVPGATLGVPVRATAPLARKNSARKAALELLSSPPTTTRPSRLSSRATAAARSRSARVSSLSRPLHTMLKPPVLRKRACVTSASGNDQHSMQSEGTERPADLLAGGKVPCTHNNKAMHWPSSWNQCRLPWETWDGVASQERPRALATYHRRHKHS